MVHSNVIRRIFGCVSNKSQFRRKKMKVSDPNFYHFKKLSVLAQTIRSLYNSAYLKNILFGFLIVFWKIKVLLIPWYTQPALEKYILR